MPYRYNPCDPCCAEEKECLDALVNRLRVTTCSQCSRAPDRWILSPFSGGDAACPEAFQNMRPLTYSSSCVWTSVELDCAQWRLEINSRDPDGVVLTLENVPGVTVEYRNNSEWRCNNSNKVTLREWTASGPSTPFLCITPQSLTCACLPCGNAGCLIRRWDILVNGVLPGSCDDCDHFNGVHALDKTGPAGTCVDIRNLGSSCITSSANDKVAVSPGNALFPAMGLRFYNDGPLTDFVYAQYFSETYPNCSEAVEFNRASSPRTSRCQNWPDTITAVPSF